MQVQCIICDRIDTLDDSSPRAKRLRNRTIELYLCDECYKRIGDNTRKRLQSGNFRLFREKKKNDYIK